MNCKLLNLFFVFLCLLTSCKGTLDLSAHIHVPYCGGAKPTPEMEKGRLDPMDTVFVIRSFGKKQKTIQSSKSKNRKLLKFRPQNCFFSVLFVF